MDLEYEIRTDDNVADIEDDNLDISALGEITGLQEIDKLEAVGINVGDIKKLKAAGLYTMASIMMATSAQLTSIKGLSEAKVQKIIECVKKVRFLNMISHTTFSRTDLFSNHSGTILHSFRWTLLVLLQHDPFVKKEKL